MALDPIRATEIVAMLLGVAYVVLAALRNRWCWVPGAVSSALVAALSFKRELPMQAALNVYYVGMAAYGYWNWTRSSSAGELRVGTLGWRWHLLAAVCIVPLSWVTAGILARETQAAWPLLDSLTTWFSLFATWLVARARIENWIYWIIIDGVLVYLFYMQDLPFLAGLFAILAVVALAGFIGWQRRLKAQAVPA